MLANRGPAPGAGRSAGPTAGVAVADPDALPAALARRPSLAGEQRRMVAAVTSRGRGCNAWSGVAGAGKTFALDAARDAWETSGITVIGAALAARAAAELQAGSGIPSTTLDRLLLDAERPGPGGGLPYNGVVVVDEAAMVGTRKLDRLLTIAERSRTAVVLVGDPRQLPEIEAGGAFAALTGAVPTVELHVNRRQVEEWERARVGRAALRASRRRGDRLPGPGPHPPLRRRRNVPGGAWSTTGGRPARKANRPTCTPCAASTSTTSTAGPGTAWPKPGSSGGGGDGRGAPVRGRRHGAGVTQRPAPRRHQRHRRPRSPRSTPPTAASPSKPATRRWCCRPSTSTPATCPTATPPRSTKRRAPPPGALHPRLRPPLPRGRLRHPVAGSDPQRPVPRRPHPRERRDHRDLDPIARLAADLVPLACPAPRHPPPTKSRSTATLADLEDERDRLRQQIGVAPARPQRRPATTRSTRPGRPGKTPNARLDAVGQLPRRQRASGPGGGGTGRWATPAPGNGGPAKRSTVPKPTGSSTSTGSPTTPPPWPATANWTSRSTDAATPWRPSPWPTPPPTTSTPSARRPSTAPTGNGGPTPRRPSTPTGTAGTSPAPNPSAPHPTDRRTRAANAQMARTGHRRPSDDTCARPQPRPRNGALTA